MDQSNFGYETVHNEFICRSRLEANRASLFDDMGWKYQYEPRAFDTKHRMYLPDFFLFFHGLWIEIKPEVPSLIEFEKLRDVNHQIHGRAIFFCGFPKISGQNLSNGAVYDTDGRRVSFDDFFEGWQMRAGFQSSLYRLNKPGHWNKPIHIKDRILLALLRDDPKGR